MGIHAPTTPPAVQLMRFFLCAPRCAPNPCGAVAGATRLGGDARAREVAGNHRRRSKATLEGWREWWNDLG